MRIAGIFGFIRGRLDRLLDNRFIENHTLSATVQGYEDLNGNPYVDSQTALLFLISQKMK